MLNVATPRSKLAVQDQRQIGSLGCHSSSRACFPCSVCLACNVTPATDTRWLIPTAARQPECRDVAPATRLNYGAPETSGSARVFKSANPGASSSSSSYHPGESWTRAGAVPYVGRPPARSPRSCVDGRGGPGSTAPIGVHGP